MSARSSPRGRTRCPWSWRGWPPVPPGRGLPQRPGPNPLMPASPDSPYTAATNRVHPRHRAQLHHSRSRNSLESFPGTKARSQDDSDRTHCHAAACVAVTPARLLWPGVAGCCRRCGGCLGEPGVQPCPDLLWGVGAAAPLVPGDHYPAGRHACEGCQAEYLPPAHLPRLRLCLACASAWMRPWR